MSLVVCQDCQAQISDVAPACPRCGRPRSPAPQAYALGPGYAPQGAPAPGYAPQAAPPPGYAPQYAPYAPPPGHAPQPAPAAGYAQPYAPAPGYAPASPPMTPAGEADQLALGWKIALYVGLIVPYVGPWFIVGGSSFLYYAWKDKHPKKAASINRHAWIAFIIGNVVWGALYVVSHS